MRIKYILIIATIFTAIITSCTKNEVPKPVTPINKKKVVETTLQGIPVKLELYSEYDSLFVGYNPLYITLTDTVTKSVITNADVSILPVMDMVTMKHSCPVDQPLYTATEKAYTGAAAFTMATMGNMGWTIEVTTKINGTQYKNTVPVTVKSTGSNIKLIGSTKDNNNVPYYVVLVRPQKPEQKVGLNDLEVAVYKRNTMMDFPAVDAMTLTFEPTMPSMGSHSSPNNINPTFVSKGHYKGKVNFSMTGDWRLTFTLNAADLTFANPAIVDVFF